MPYKLATADAVIARLAARQHGVVTARQLTAAGVGRMAVSERTRNGRLHRVHRGVYAVGHPALSLHGRFMAAVSACGDRAVLSHGSAAVLWELLRPLDGPMDVSVPARRNCRSLSEVRVHCRGALATEWWSGAVTRRHLVPVTTVPRTLIDLDGTLSPHLVRRAIRQAEQRGYRLEGVASDRTRSDLEAIFLALCNRFALPRPEVNVELGRWEVDFLWRFHRLAVEVDTFAYHRGSVGFEADHARDLDLSARGYLVRRYTGTQVETEPERVAGDIAAILAAGAPS